MIVEDGLTSVLRGFKRKELENISKQLQVQIIKLNGNGHFVFNGF